MLKCLCVLFGADFGEAGVDEESRIDTSAGRGAAEREVRGDEVCCGIAQSFQGEFSENIIFLSRLGWILFCISRATSLVILLEST